MTSRREFPRAVKVAIIRRATRGGVTYCEGCGAMAKVWHIDHTNPDALQVDKSRPLTAEDGRLLCAGSKDTCHGRKTAEEDIPAIARAKRREAAHLGVRRARTPIPQRPKAERPSTKAPVLGLPRLARQGLVPAGPKEASSHDR